MPASAGSESVSSAALLADAGVRFTAALTSTSKWKVRVQLGMTAWLATDEETVDAGPQRYRLQEPGLGLALGFTVDRH